MGIGHYALGQKFDILAKTFGCFQSLVNTIGTFEKSLYKGKDHDDMDMMVILLAIIQSLAYVSYCQRSIATA